MNAEPLWERIAGLERAVARLAEVLVQPKNEFLRDAAIKRFELTFELAWKALKSYLAYQGLEARSPREPIRGAFAAGLLPEDEGWLALIELRNLTIHTYDEALAEQVYAELPDALSRFRTLLEQLKNTMS